MSSVGPVKDYVAVFNKLYEVVPDSFGAWGDLVCEMDGSRVVQVGEFRGGDCIGLMVEITAVGMGSGGCVQEYIFENGVPVACIHQARSVQRRWDAADKFAKVPKHKLRLLRLCTGADIPQRQ
jgi:hypothetical protein